MTSISIFSVTKTSAFAFVGVARGVLSVGSPTNKMNEDLFLGSVKLEPPLNACRQYQQGRVLKRKVLREE
jgi:hypothetical protein